MFEWISEVLSNIANFFTTAWDFIIHIFKEIVYIVTLLGNIILNIPSYFTWLPASVLALLVIGIGIVVIYKIAGREG